MASIKQGASDDLHGFVSDSNAVIGELRKESDRGAALVALEYLDALSRT